MRLRCLIAGFMLAVMSLMVQAGPARFAVEVGRMGEGGAFGMNAGFPFGADRVAITVSAEAARSE